MPSSVRLTVQPVRVSLKGSGDPFAGWESGEFDYKESVSMDCGRYDYDWMD